MNIFTTLEQAKRLKKAGFPQGVTENKWVLFSEIDDSRQEWLLVKEHMNAFWYTQCKQQIPYMFTKTTAREIIDAPTAQEIMEEIAKTHHFFVYGEPIKGYNIHIRYVGDVNSPDLIEALVQAYEKIKKGE